VEQHQADVRQVAGRLTSVDDTARFLRELRQLRDGAGLGHAELAARAHYPYDSIKAAEVGPSLPDLPVLSAFVRGCGGTTEEWEERWRSLTRTPSLPLSEARSAGDSAAAVAGARIGSVAQGAENPDPSIIMAALNRVAEGMASGNDDAPADSPAWADFPPGDSAAFPPGDSAAFPADAPADALVGPEPDAPAAFPADAQAFPPDAPAFVQAEDLAGFQPDDPAGSGTDAQAAPFAPPAAADGPAADRRPAGWDPIRMSSAWPALPDSPIDAALTAEVPPWETAPWAEDPSAAAAPRGTAASSGWAKPQRDGHARARSPRRADRAGVAGSAASRTWMIAVGVVLLCVVAVVLALFA
jgi:hypothetical protein